MNRVNWNDKVKIETEELIGEGVVTKFHNDKYNGVEVKIIFLARKSDGKKAKPGCKVNFYQEDLTTIEAMPPLFSYKIEDDTLMQELYDSETAREEAIPVITPEFCGKWSK